MKSKKTSLDELISKIKGLESQLNQEIEKSNRLEKMLTEQKKIYQQLNESEKLYRNLINSAPLGISLLQDGLIKIANPAIAKIHGYDSPEEMLGKPSIDIVAPKYKQIMKERGIRRRKGLKEPNFYEYDGLKKDGSVIPISVIGVEKISFMGRSASFGFTEDITVKKRLEAQIRRAQKLESLGILAGGIAHDFNNILMAIIGNASMGLSEVESNSPLYELFEDILESSEQAAKLSQKMLAFSGKGRFVIENYNLNSVILEERNLFENSISESVKIEYNLSPIVPSVELDSNQFRQLMMNLIINASEAIGDKEGKITLTTGISDFDEEYITRIYNSPNLKAGTYVFVEVHDTGEGMDQETIDKIFDPFYTTKFTGRGLGLSVVDGIVRGHNGVIRVFSEKNIGTTFNILIPCAEGIIDRSNINI